MARLLAALSSAPKRGRTKRQLMKSMNLPDDDKGTRDFRRDLANLKKRGWDIRPGDIHNGYHYRINVIDQRIRESFTESERAELFRVAQSAKLGGLYDDLQPDRSDRSFGTNARASDDLEKALHSRQYHCLMEFTYHGKTRLVDPIDVISKADRWMLRAREVGDSIVKNFYLDEAVNLTYEAPGSAAPPPSELTSGRTDPLRFSVHSQIPVVLAAEEININDVRSALGSLSFSVAQTRQPDGSIIFEVTTTNLKGLFMRVYELGTRVRVMGPPDVIDALRESLEWALEGSP